MVLCKCLALLIFQFQLEEIVISIVISFDYLWTDLIFVVRFGMEGEHGKTTAFLQIAFVLRLECFSYAKLGRPKSGGGVWAQSTKVTNSKERVNPHLSAKWATFWQKCCTLCECQNPTPSCERIQNEDRCELSLVLVKSKWPSID